MTSNISNSEGHKDNIIQDRKKDNPAFCNDVSVEHKKANKRTRESDEESSISSDDDVLSKKKIKKISEERFVSFRSKKVSDAARRRREAVKTVRERKIAALETDSECDSDDVSEKIKADKVNFESDLSKESEKYTVSNTKQHSDFKDEKVARNQKSHINDVKSKKSQRKSSTETVEKTNFKNEESSSAYNSDSDCRVNIDIRQSGRSIDSDVENNKLKYTSKVFLSNDSSKKYDTSQRNKSKSDNLQNYKHCILTNKRDDKLNDTSKDDSDGDRVQSPVAKVKICAEGSEILKNSSSKCTRHKAKHKKSCKSQLLDSDSEESDGERSLSERKVASDVKNSKIKNKASVHALKNVNSCHSNSDCSSDEIYLKRSKPTVENSRKETKLKQKDQNSSPVSNENSSDDEQSQKINVKSTQERMRGGKVEQQDSKKSVKNEQLSSSENSSDSDGPLKKSKSVKKLDSLEKSKSKLSQRSESDSSIKDDTSNNDHPRKKNVPSQQKYVQRKGKALKQSFKDKNYSTEESSSDNDRPVKKTKSSKVQKFSDLKSKNKRKSKKKDSESSDNNFEKEKENKPSKQSKTSDTPLKPKITVTKKCISKQKTSDTSDSEGVSEKINEKIPENIHDKSGGFKKKLTKSSHLSDESADSSDDSDLSHKKSTKSKGKVSQKKSNAQIVSKEEQKISDGSELSDSVRENHSGKKQMKDSTKIKPQEIKKELSDSETSSGGTTKIKPQEIKKEPSDSETSSGGTTKIKPQEIKKELSDSETSSGGIESKNKFNKSCKVSKMSKEKDGNDSCSSRELLKQKVKHEISDSADSSNSECDSKYHKDVVNKTKETDKKKSSSSDGDSDSSKLDTKRKKKATNVADRRINNLKKYVRECGIRINNYATLFKGCVNNGQRGDKLLELMRNLGMTGRPTLVKCKKLRLRLERKREVEELDLRNIIDTEEDTGRYKCRSSRRDSIEKKPSQINAEQQAAERAADLKQKFSRIKALINSDSSSE